MDIIARTVMISIGYGKLTDLYMRLMSSYEASTANSICYFLSSHMLFSQQDAQNNFIECYPLQDVVEVSRLKYVIKFILDNVQMPYSDQQKLLFLFDKVSKEKERDLPIPVNHYIHNKYQPNIPLPVWNNLVAVISNHPDINIDERFDYFYEYDPESGLCFLNIKTSSPNGYEYYRKMVIDPKILHGDTYRIKGVDENGNEIWVPIIPYGKTVSRMIQDTNFKVPTIIAQDIFGSMLDLNLYDWIDMTSIPYLDRESKIMMNNNLLRIINQVMASRDQSLMGRYRISEYHNLYNFRLTSDNRVRSVNYYNPEVGEVKTLPITQSKVDIILRNGEIAVERAQQHANPSILDMMNWQRFANQFDGGPSAQGPQQIDFSTIIR